MRKLLLWSATFLGVSFMMTSCQFMPEEAVLPQPPVIRSYEMKSYRQDTVQRGDLILQRKMNCTYMPAKEEKLSFEIGGVLIDSVYVSEGQKVEKGDLLVTLEQENMLEELASQEYKLKVLALEKEHAAEQEELDKILLALNAQKRGEEEEEIESSYAKQQKEIEDSIYIETLRLQEMKEELRKRELRASIAGTITKITQVEDGDRSVRGAAFVTVSDMDTTVFTVKGTDADFFKTGDRVTIECQRKEYEAYVIEPSELGIEKGPDADGGNKVVYLKMEYPDPTLEENARGTINLTLEEKKDVLYVNNKAIKTSNGEQFVYMLDEDGMRVMRPVTTGMESGSLIEITSGLEEGEVVILE